MIRFINTISHLLIKVAIVFKHFHFIYFIFEHVEIVFFSLSDFVK